MKHKKVPSHTQINWPVYQDVKSNRFYVVLDWGKVSLTKIILDFKLQTWKYKVMKRYVNIIQN